MTLNEPSKGWDQNKGLIEVFGWLKKPKPNTDVSLTVSITWEPRGIWWISIKSWRTDYLLIPLPLCAIMSIFFREYSVYTI